MRVSVPIVSVLVLIASVSAKASPPVKILAFGDSLTAGPGLKVSETFPAQLEKALNAAGVSATVINAGVSGDTSTGGLARLAWMLEEKPQVVIVELGANDGLRGVDPDVTHAKLDAILSKLEEQKLAVLFAGMRMPPNMGDYSKRFDAVFLRLAKEHPGVVYYPFFLEGVARDPKLNLDDGIHPNPEGVKRIVERILPYVRRAIANH